MELLVEIANQVHNSKTKWFDLAATLGIDENEVSNLTQKENAHIEFVYAITKSIWNRICQHVDIHLIGTDDYVTVSNLNQVASILSNEKLVREPNNPTGLSIVKEISEHLSQWKAFGRVLGLKEAFLKQLETNFKSCEERNIAIMKKFCEPSPVYESWVLWREYLSQFDDGQCVIKEIETTHIHLMAQVEQKNSHIIMKESHIFMGHVIENEHVSKIDREDSTISVPVGSESLKIEDMQRFPDWVLTQERYIKIYNMLKDVKSIDFIDGVTSSSLILNTLKNYLEKTNDNGFALKGYNFVNHFSLFKKGIFAKESSNESYFCYFANDDVALFVTKATNGIGCALNQASRNIEIANHLHEALGKGDTTQVSLIICDDENNIEFCKECMDNYFCVTETKFLESFYSIYRKLFLENVHVSKLKKRFKKSKLVCTNDIAINLKTNDIAINLKKEMITYESLESAIFPSFTYIAEDQIEELKKLILLSPVQFEVLRSNKKYILLRGAYGCGKSLVLIKKLEQVISLVQCSDIIYFICNDPQSQYIHYMKFIQSKQQRGRIIVCASSSLIPGQTLPKLSVLLNHIKNAWKRKRVHIFIDEFTGSYIDKNEVYKINELLKYFENSYIVISLQSMEEQYVGDKSYMDIGYQMDLLTMQTSFYCFNLDYSLRSSNEICQFVKSTAEIIESAKISSYDNINFIDSSKSLFVDNEQGREAFGQGKGNIKGKYVYNQNCVSGHEVTCGPVNIYYIGEKLLSKVKPGNEYTMLISTLHHILKNRITEDRTSRFVVCTYDEELYNAAYYLLSAETEMYKTLFTDNIKDFVESGSNFSILLTEHSGVRGYEFANFIFLLPVGKKYLKYRMLECFTRATTTLYIVVNNTKNAAKTIDKQLIKKWKQLECVDFMICKPCRDKSKIYFVNQDNGEVFQDEIKPCLSGNLDMYPWNSPLVPFDLRRVSGSKLFDDALIAIGCIFASDDVELFKDICILHEIDVVSYRDNLKDDLLILSIKQKAKNISIHLIKNYQCNLHYRNRKYRTALHIASKEGQLEVCKALVNEGASIDVEDSDLTTPLHMSAKSRHEELVKWFVEHGANLYATDRMGISPLQIITKYSKSEFVDSLKSIAETFDKE